MMLRIHNAARKTAVGDAIKFELRQRLLGRYAEMGSRIQKGRVDSSYVFVSPLFDGDHPAPPLSHLANCMAHARRHAAAAARLEI